MRYFLYHVKFLLGASGAGAGPGFPLQFLGFAHCKSCGIIRFNPLRGFAIRPSAKKQNRVYNAVRTPEQAVQKP
jgi:hypothetical protein